MPEPVITGERATNPIARLEEAGRVHLGLEPANRLFAV